MFKDYYEIRQWLESFIPQVWTRKELGLDRISHLLKLLGNPQNKFKSIHIAGTSGKGSTAFYISRLLQGSSQFTVHSSQKPMKVGLHISPHLVDIRERMQINGKLIELNKFIKLIGEIKPAVESMKDSKVGYPSYFEILVAASFLYFAKEKVDWAVVEVGLGGRLDATNVLHPQLSVITNVGLDHTDVLGKTQEKIAFEKAGIIKVGVPVVTGCPSTHFVRSGLRLRGRSDSRRSLNLHNSSGSSRKALEVIQKVARQQKAPLITINTQSYKKALKSEVFSSINLPIDIFRSTPDNFASSNKLLALAAVKTLGVLQYSNPYSSSEVERNREVPTKIDSRQAQIINHVFNSTFPGRFEEIEKGVILDGAHNVDKVRFLTRWIKEKTTDYRLQTTAVDRRQWTVVLIIAFKKGKDWKKMVDLLVKNLPVSKVIATKFHAVTDMGKHQAVDPKEIARYIKSKWKVTLRRAQGDIERSRNIKVESQNNSHEAVFGAVNCQLSIVNCLVLVTGSLYLVGEVRTIWKLSTY